MIPRRATATTGLEVRIIGGVRVPTIAPLPDGATAADCEAAAVDYALRVTAPRPQNDARELSYAAFDVLAGAATLKSFQVAPGRWSNRPPAPGVQAARFRLDPPHYARLERALPTLADQHANGIHSADLARLPDRFAAPLPIEAAIPF